MALELSLLQKRCLAGIGITPWQQRKHVSILASHSNVVDEQAIKEPTANYEHVITQNGVVDNKDIISEAFVIEIELAINYVIEHGGIKLDWKVDKHASSLAIIEDTLIIPDASEFLSNNDVKKQAWSLLLNHQC